MERSDVQILVVDDESLICTTFKTALEEWGYSVEITDNGENAYKKLLNQDYHILMTDMHMPQMDGLSLLKRAKSRSPYMEIIMITGYATVEAAIDAMKMGATDFVLKPINFIQVKSIVNKCYQKIKAESENEELRELNAQLRELNDLKDKFLSLTNHEIRTPLTIIKGYLQILEHMIQDEAAELQEIFTIIKKASEELHETADRMHVLSRTHGHGLQIQRSNQDTCKLLQQITADMAPLFKHRSISFSAEIPETALFNWGSQFEFRLLIRELLYNALKFTPDHGRVDVKIYPEADHSVIHIEDTGIGIPYDKQELIFTDFYEVQDAIRHKSSKESFMGGGMGIGLSMVKEITTTLKGKILLTSEPEKGSIFKIYLPLVHKTQEKIVDVATS